MELVASNMRWGAAPKSPGNLLTYVLHVSLAAAGILPPITNLGLHTAGLFPSHDFIKSHSVDSVEVNAHGVFRRVGIDGTSTSSSLWRLNNKTKAQDRFHLLQTSLTDGLGDDAHLKFEHLNDLVDMMKNSEPKPETCDWECTMGAQAGAPHFVGDSGLPQPWNHCSNFGYQSVDSCKARCLRVEGCIIANYDPKCGKKGCCCVDNDGRKTCKHDGICVIAKGPPESVTPPPTEKRAANTSGEEEEETEKDARPEALPLHKWTHTGQACQLFSTGECEAAVASGNFHWECFLRKHVANMSESTHANLITDDFANNGGQLTTATDCGNYGFSSAQGCRNRCERAGGNCTWMSFDQTCTSDGGRCCCSRADGVGRCGAQGICHISNATREDLVAVDENITGVTVSSCRKLHKKRTRACTPRDKWHCVDANASSLTGGLDDIGRSNDYDSCSNFGWLSLEHCKQRCARVAGCKYINFDMDAGPTGGCCRQGRGDVDRKNSTPLCGVRGFCYLASDAIFVPPQYNATHNHETMPNLSNWQPVGRTCKIPDQECLPCKPWMCVEGKQAGGSNVIGENGKTIEYDSCDNFGWPGLAACQERCARVPNCAFANFNPDGIDEENCCTKVDEFGRMVRSCGKKNFCMLAGVEGADQYDLPINTEINISNWTVAGTMCAVASRECMKLGVASATGLKSYERVDVGFAVTNLNLSRLTNTTVKELKNELAIKVAACAKVLMSSIGVKLSPDVDLTSVDVLIHVGLAMDRDREHSNFVRKKLSKQGECPTELQPQFRNAVHHVSGIYDGAIGRPDLIDVSTVDTFIPAISALAGALEGAVLQNVGPGRELYADRAGRRIERDVPSEYADAQYVRGFWNRAGPLSFYAEENLDLYIMLRCNRKDSHLDNPKVMMPTHAELLRQGFEKTSDPMPTPGFGCDPAFDNGRSPVYRKDVDKESIVNITITRYTNFVLMAKAKEKALNTKCPWIDPWPEPDRMMCGDGGTCSVEHDGWDCCDKKAMRSRCPLNYPKMCNQKVNNSESYMCRVNCYAFGGERPCSVDSKWNLVMASVEGRAGSFMLSSRAEEFQLGAGEVLITWSTKFFPVSLDDFRQYENGVRFTVPDAWNIEAATQETVHGTCADKTSFVRVGVTCEFGDCQMPEEMYTGRRFNKLCSNGAYGLVAPKPGAEDGCNAPLRDVEGSALYIGGSTGGSDCHGVKDSSGTLLRGSELKAISIWTAKEPPCPLGKLTRSDQGVSSEDAWSSSGTKLGDRCVYVAQGGQGCGQTCAEQVEGAFCDSRGLKEMNSQEKCELASEGFGDFDDVNANASILQNYASDGSGCGLYVDLDAGIRATKFLKPSGMFATSSCASWTESPNQHRFCPCTRMDEAYMQEGTLTVEEEKVIKLSTCAEVLASTSGNATNGVYYLTARPWATTPEDFGEERASYCKFMNGRAWRLIFQTGGAADAKPFDDPDESDVVKDAFAYRNLYVSSTQVNDPDQSCLQTYYQLGKDARVAAIQIASGGTQATEHVGDQFRPCCRQRDAITNADPSGRLLFGPPDWEDSSVDHLAVDKLSGICGAADDGWTAFSNGGYVEVYVEEWTEKTRVPHQIRPGNPMNRSGLSIYLEFEDESGDPADTSGNGFEVVRMRDEKVTQWIKRGCACGYGCMGLYRSSAMKILHIPGLKAANDWSFMTWLKSETLSGTQTIFFYGVDYSKSDYMFYCSIQYNVTVGTNLMCEAGPGVAANGGKISSSISVISDKWNHFAVTRSAQAGEVSLYWNGEEFGPEPITLPGSMLGADPSASFYIGELVGNPDVTFEGIVDDISLWSRQLSLFEISAAKDHRQSILPSATFSDAGGTSLVGDTLGLKIPNAAITASSEGGGDPVCDNGGLAGHSRIDGLSGWCARVIDENQWLQMDLGDLETVTMIRTRGLEAAWVSEYRLSYSTDRIDWIYHNSSFKCEVDDGTQIKSNMVVPPVVARFVRIHPTRWTRAIVMRVDLTGDDGMEEACGTTTFNEMTEDVFESLENVASQTSGAQPFGSGSSSGGCTKSGPGVGESGAGRGSKCWRNINDGKVGDGFAWAPGKGFAGKHFVGIRFPQKMTIYGFRISRDATGEKKDRVLGAIDVQYSTLSGVSHNTEKPGSWCTLGTIRRERAGIYFYGLSRPVSATALRLLIQHHEKDSMPVVDELVVYGRRVLAAAPLVGSLQTPSLPDSGITSSSPAAGGCSAAASRLDGAGYCSAYLDIPEGLWLQWDFGNVMEIEMIQLRGSPNDDAWVSEFKLAYSLNASDWKSYGKTLTGSEGRFATAEALIFPPILAQKLRLIPTAWTQRIALRAEILGARAPSSSTATVYRGSPSGSLFLNLSQSFFPKDMVTHVASFSWDTLVQGDMTWDLWTSIPPQATDNFTDEVPLFSTCLREGVPCIGIHVASTGALRIAGQSVTLGAFQTAEGIADGRWHHVALVLSRSRAAADLYLDGAHSGSVSFRPAAMDYGKSGLGIGGSARSNMTIAGRFSHFRLWRSALDSEAIAQFWSSHVCYSWYSHKTERSDWLADLVASYMLSTNLDNSIGSGLGSFKPYGTTGGYEDEDMCPSHPCRGFECGRGFFLKAFSESSCKDTPCRREECCNVNLAAMVGRYNLIMSSFKGDLGKANLENRANELREGGGDLLISWSTKKDPADAGDWQTYEKVVHFTVPNITATGRNSSGRLCSNPDYFVEVVVTCIHGLCNLPPKMYTGAGFNRVCYDRAYGLVLNSPGQSQCDWAVDNQAFTGLYIGGKGCHGVKDLAGRIATNEKVRAIALWASKGFEEEKEDTNCEQLSPKCVPQFEQAGTIHDGCAPPDQDHNKRWCSHHSVYQGSWSPCQPVSCNACWAPVPECVPSFTIASTGKSFSGCSDSGHHKYWCSHKHVRGANEAGDWSNCMQVPCVENDQEAFAVWDNHVFRKQPINFGVSKDKWRLATKGPLQGEHSEMISIAVGVHYIYVVSNELKLYKQILSTLSPTTAWTFVNEGPIRSIAVYSDSLYAVCANGRVCKQGKEELSETSAWIEVSRGDVTALSVYEEVVYAVSPKGTVLRQLMVDMSIDSEWEEVSAGSVTTIAVHRGYIYATRVPDRLVLTQNVQMMTKSTAWQASGLTDVQAIAFHEDSLMPSMDLVAAEQRGQDVIDAAGPFQANYGRINISKEDGVPVWDLTSRYFERQGGEPWRIGQFYTNCYWIKWRLEDSSDPGGDRWRTLLRGTNGAVDIRIKYGTKKLGMYINEWGFRDSGFEVDVAKWNFVCVVGEAKSPATSFGTSKFYVGTALPPNKEPPPDVNTSRSNWWIAKVQEVGSVDRVIAGSLVHRLGWGPWQGPGKIAMAKSWNRVMSETEIQNVFDDTLPDSLRRTTSTTTQTSETTTSITTTSVTDTTTSRTTISSTTTFTTMPEHPWVSGELSFFIQDADNITKNNGAVEAVKTAVAKLQGLTVADLRWITITANPPTAVTSREGEINVEWVTLSTVDTDAVTHKYKNRTAENIETVIKSYLVAADINSARNLTLDKSECKKETPPPTPIPTEPPTHAPTTGETQSTQTTTNPPSFEPTEEPTMEPPWLVSFGGCDVVGERSECVQSPGYPNPYPSSDECIIEVKAEAPLIVREFDTEATYDWLKVRGVKYSGPKEMTTNITGQILNLGELVKWHADKDGTEQKKGWELCMDLAPLTTKTTTEASTLTTTMTTQTADAMQAYEITVFISLENFEYAQLETEDQLQNTIESLIVHKLASLSGASAEDALIKWLPGQGGFVTARVKYFVSRYPEANVVRTLLSSPESIRREVIDQINLVGGIGDVSKGRIGLDTENLPTVSLSPVFEVTSKFEVSNIEYDSLAQQRVLQSVFKTKVANELAERSGAPAANVSLVLQSGLNGSLVVKARYHSSSRSDAMAMKDKWMQPLGCQAVVDAVGQVSGINAVATGSVTVENEGHTCTMNHTFAQDDDKVTMFQVSFTLAAKGIGYENLLQHSLLQASFKGSVLQTLADMAGFPKESCSLALSEGSDALTTNIEVKFVGPTEDNASAVKAAWSSSASVCQTVATAVNQVDGIHSVVSVGWSLVPNRAPEMSLILVPVTRSFVVARGDLVLQVVSPISFIESADCTESVVATLARIAVVPKVLVKVEPKLGLSLETLADFGLHDASAGSAPGFVDVQFWIYASSEVGLSSSEVVLTKVRGVDLEDFTQLLNNDLARKGLSQTADATSLVSYDMVVRDWEKPAGADTGFTSGPIAVDGVLALQVDDPKTFINDSRTQDALLDTVADMAGCLRQNVALEQSSLKRSKDESGSNSEIHIRYYIFGNLSVADRLLPKIRSATFITLTENILDNLQSRGTDMRVESARVIGSQAYKGNIEGNVTVAAHASPVIEGELAMKMTTPNTFCAAAGTGMKEALKNTMSKIVGIFSTSIEISSITCPADDSSPGGVVEVKYKISEKSPGDIDPNAMLMRIRGRTPIEISEALKLELEVEQVPLAAYDGLEVTASMTFEASE